MGSSFPKTVHSVDDPNDFGVDSEGYFTWVIADDEDPVPDENGRIRDEQPLAPWIPFQTPLPIPKYEREKRTPEELEIWIKKQRKIRRKRIFMSYQAAQLRERMHLSRVMKIIADNCKDRTEGTPLTEIDPGVISSAFDIVDKQIDRIHVAEALRVRNYCLHDPQLIPLVDRYFLEPRLKKMAMSILTCADLDWEEPEINLFYEIPDENLPEYMDILLRR